MRSLVAGGMLLMIAVAEVVFIEGKRVSTHRYLKQETMLKHLTNESFLTKSPAPWMLEQIEEDFKGIEKIAKEDVDESFAKVKAFSPMLVRYRIVGNELYRYFTEGEPISLEDNGTERAIKTLIQKAELPNMDFILSYYDGYPCAGICPKDLKAPILVSAKLKQAPNGILIPDWRSIGAWWISDIKSVKKAQVPWEKKKNFALWRGGLTKTIRYKLCQLSLDFPDILDARLSSYPEDPDLRKKIDEEGVMGDRCSWEEFLECKYLPYVDGVMCAAPALQWRLLSGSVTFKPDSNEIQWFYRALKPNIHYVPVKNDLSDLIGKLKWASAHDAECKKIAENARRFAEDNLMYNDVLNYFFYTLKRYGECQGLETDVLKKEIDRDPRWVKIQFRGKLRDLVDKGCLNGYCLEGTPASL